MGSLTLRRFNFWAILLGSAVMDLEPLTLVLVQNCYSCPHHGFFHSILGAISGSLILAIILRRFREKLGKISLRFKISQSFSFQVLFFSSLTAWLTHIFFDSLTHNDVFPFWPLKLNPVLIGRELYWPLGLILLILGVIGSVLFYRKLRSKT